MKSTFLILVLAGFLVACGNNPERAETEVTNVETEQEAQTSDPNSAPTEVDQTTTEIENATSEVDSLLKEL